MTQSGWRLSRCSSPVLSLLLDELRDKTGTLSPHERRYAIALHCELVGRGNG